MATASRLLVLAGLLIALVLPRGALAVESAESPGSDDAVRFRTTFGFPSDAATVSRSLSDSVRYSNLDWGVPLSSAEASEMARRIEVREAIAPASDYAISEFDYAGVVIDQKRGGLPIFLFTGSIDEHRRELQALVPPGVDFEVKQVARSMADLVALQEEVDAARHELEAGGFPVNLTGIKPSQNAVVVGVEEPSVAAAKALVSRFGDGVVLRANSKGHADACTSVANCPPAKGGIRMTWSLNPAVYCTVGWVGKRTDTSARVIVTAGHCLELNGGSGDLWRHNGVSLATSLNETWANFADADVGLLTIHSSSQPTTRNQVLATPDTGIRQINAVRANTSQHEGDALCRIGAGTDAQPGQTGRTCGILSNYNVTNDSCNPAETDCRPIDHTNEVDFDSVGGDSGGPVFQYSPTPGYVIGYGTHVHSEDPADDVGWFSPINYGITTYDAFNPYTYSICLTAAC